MAVPPEPRTHRRGEKGPDKYLPLTVTTGFREKPADSNGRCQISDQSSLIRRPARIGPDLETLS
jgi:hypothetical protein